MNEEPALRRHLVARLKALRAQAGLTQSQIAKTLEWSSSKIIRIEDESVGIGVTDLRALLAEYGVTDAAVIDELVDIARRSRVLPFNEFRDILTKDGIRYFGYETSASFIRQVQPLMVPGLLQTEEYARAILNSRPPRSGARELTPELMDRIVETRWRRQQALEDATGPHAVFVLDEAVLHRQVGGRETMRRQIEHMLRMNEFDRVSIRVLRFSLGAHSAMRGPFVHLEFADVHDPEIVYLENTNPLGGNPQFITGSADVSPYLETFVYLEELAAPADDLRQITSELPWMATSGVRSN